MASFSIEDFVGGGVLKELLPKLLEEGWDDVPTLKIMNSEDMDAINLTQHQKVSYPFIPRKIISSLLSKIKYHLIFIYP